VAGLDVDQSAGDRFTFSVFGLGIRRGEIVIYGTFMVHLELGRSNARLLEMVGDLAGRFDAGVIGIAACQPMQITYGDSYVSGDLIERDREEIQKEIKAAEAEFRDALHTRASNLECRSAVTFGSVSDYLAREARSADLVITGVDRNALLFDSSRHVSIGDLVMQIGRPVLIVPAAADRLRLERVIVGWKDTRETRRVALDALPLLKRADHVVVAEIAAEEELAVARTHVEDVVGWLERHGVVAEALACRSNGDDASRLNDIAQEQNADLIVAGAYGHSRLREWVLGGVTRDLLLRADRCSLVSH
jgi:nucleotide-binding universal stress UspA family protein